MNATTPIGFILAVLIVWVCVISSSPNPAALLELKGLILVIGGTLSSSLIIFPFNKIVGLYKFLIYGVVFKSTVDIKLLATEIINASVFKKEEHNLFPHLPTSHPFLKEGLALFAEGMPSESDLETILKTRSQYFKQSYMNDAKMLSTLAKFPSSLGMLGSTVGLIDMMSNLGKNGGEGIGPAMAMALVATFWGLVLTYMVLTPLAEYAARLSQEDNKVREMIIAGLLMIRRAEPAELIIEKLNGYLAITDRLSSKDKLIPADYWKTARKDIAVLKDRPEKQTGSNRKAA